jgi:isocitrate/isopropylmalate dehydrogenase
MQIERIARVGFETARKRTGKMVSVDKVRGLYISNTGPLFSWYRLEC